MVAPPFQEEPMFERKVLLLTVAVALAATVTAQTIHQHSGPPPGRVTSFGFGPAANMIPAVKNAPFSGVAHFANRTDAR
jgi:hypothetical protein